MTQSEREKLLLGNMGVLHLASKRTCPPHIELDDWVSDVTLQVWRKLHTYNPERGKITTWIFTVAIRQSLQVRRLMTTMKRSNHVTVSLSRMRSPALSETGPMDPADYRNETAEQIDCRLDIHAVIKGMIRSDREFVSTIMDGSKDGEFAREKGISRQRVNILRERALGRLHKKLSKTPYGLQKGK